MKLAPLPTKEGEPKLRVHGIVARRLGIEIVSGKRAPGEVFEDEIEASAGLNISRTAYREAIRILAAKGLIDSRPKRGTRVLERRQWHMLDPDVLSWVFDFEPSEAMIADLFELRKIVEPEAAAIAALRRTDLQLQALASALAAMKRFGLSTAEGQRADKAFHEVMLESTRNTFLLSLSTGIVAAVAWTTIFKRRLDKSPRDAIPDHERVFKAIQRQDHAAARAAMAELVELALKDTLAARQIQQDGQLERGRKTR